MCYSDLIDNTSGPIWRPGDKERPSPANPDGAKNLYRPDILEVIESKIAELDAELRALSLDIHAHPELGYEEHHAHDVLTAFMIKRGFEVEKHYHLDTAWKATFSHGSGGRVIGVNSEMDALKGIGHACGHNLIAIAGIAVACAIKSAIEKFDISGTVMLLGTPAEERGSGKLVLLEKGAYKDMDACLMCHPGPGPIGSINFFSCISLQRLEIEYFGHTAHAALSPWEGINALDAAVLGYNNISALRQQLRPTHQVHGVFGGRDWAPNIIPDYAKMTYHIRAPTRAEVEMIAKRVVPCFNAAGLATGCEVKIHFGGLLYDMRQNKALAGEVANIVLSKYGDINYESGAGGASSDFSNVTYELPSLHPGFAIPTIPNGGNHTPGFEKAASTVEAHYACLNVSKALASTGVRVLIDDEFMAEVKKTFEKDQQLTGKGVVQG
ncbi:hypothetical protein BD779DRAFT_1507551 [Infundibulicybe gibba]|nr:hypothetical protein BD779DRAFT_1507551 [Infundibulicybe gibba]